MRVNRFSLRSLSLSCLVIFLSLLPSAVVNAKAQEANCSLERLSGDEVQCWNSLFGDFLAFKTIFSSEVVDFGDHETIGVLFTALGTVKKIPINTLILPYASSYSGDQSIESGYLRNDAIQQRVFYGLFTKSSTSPGMHLKIFGELDMWPCAPGDTSSRLEQNELAGHPWVKNKKSSQVQLCRETPTDEFYYIKSQRLVSNMPIQIAYKYGPAGEASGIYDYLFILKKGEVTPLFNAWHDKYGMPRGDSKIRYEKDKIIEHSSLHTPFEGDTHYFSSLTAKRIHVWRKDGFVVTEESIAPLFVTLDDPNGFIGEYNEKVDKMRKQQVLFDSGKERWLGDPLEVAKKKCDTCSNFRLAFMKEGVAVVWADYLSNGIAQTMSIHLYKPLYLMKGIGSRSIWAAALDEAGFSHDGFSGAMGMNPRSDNE